MAATSNKPHLVLLSSPGLGHLIPVLELGKRLLALQSFQVTIFVAASHSSPAEAQVLRSAMTPNTCNIVNLPPVDISGLVDPSAAVTTQICTMMRETRPALRAAISALEPRPSALIVDLFGTESLAIADELEIPKFVYIASNAWFLAVTVYAPMLDKEVEGEFVDQKEPISVPGCRTVRPEDVPDPMLDRTDQHYFEYLRIGSEIPTGDGILLNIWEDLQPDTFSALGKIVKVPVFPIGPLTRPVGSSESMNQELFGWLDQQPKESVVYVSFGSGGTLSFEQMTELAWGIELSQQRFIWVVRPPTIKTGDGAFFTAGEGGDDVSGYLPDGFMSRTRDVGLVVPQWAPQADILGQPSVGGFLSHCGWNSSLESIINGVPMIVWPLYAEQRLNATLLCEELGVAVRSKTLPSKGVVGREEIEMMIKKIMVDDEEGRKIRNRAKELKNGAEKALSKGGSSYNALNAMANIIEKKQLEMHGD